LCPAREGWDECIFCEDGELCPLSRMKPAAVGSSAPMLRDDARLSPKKLAQKRAAAMVSVQVKSEEKQMPELAKTCSVVGCGKVLRSNNETGRCSKHFYVPKSERRSAKPKKPRSNGHSDPIAGDRVTMSVSAAWLDRAWARLDPELKAVAIAAALEA
jgi:hypothetical protein